MATDDQGGGPTDLSGVTFIGKGGAEGSSESYHIKRSTGKVLGPFDTELIKEMIRSGKLTGDEGVSQDRSFWIPIMAVPDLAQVFREAEEAGSDTQLGLKTVGDKEEAQRPTLVESLEEPLHLESTAQRPPPLPGTAPGGPASSEFAGAPEATSVGGLASGAFSPVPLGEAIEESVAGIQVSEREALSQVPGVRKLSPDMPGMPGGPTQSTNELPMPHGFTNFPLPADEIPQFPVPKEGAPSGGTLTQPVHSITETQPPDAPPLGFGPPPTSDAGGDPSYSTAELPVDGSDLPVSAGTDLPISAQTSAELPASTHGKTVGFGAGDLSNLPTSTTNLPQSADNLPQSADNLPQSADNLPQSTLDTGQSPGSSPPKFGTVAMSGLGFDDLTGDTGAVGQAGGPSAELPASLRQTGASVLDTMAQTDDIWAAPETAAPPTAEAPEQSQKEFRTESFSFTGGNPLEALEQAHKEGGGAMPAETGWPVGDAVPSPPDDDFADFFPGDGEGMVTTDLPLEDIAETAEPERKEEKPKKKRSIGSGYGIKILMMVALLAILGGAAFFIKDMLASRGDDPSDPVVAPVDAGPIAVAVELPPITELYGSGHPGFVEYIDLARTAVGDRGAPDDRAALLLSTSWLLVDHPENEQLYEEMRRTFDALTDVPEDAANADLVATARAAFLAAIASDDAPDALEAARQGEFAAIGHLFTGFYDIQRSRGVSFAEPEPPAAAPIEGSGDAESEAEGAGAEEAGAEGEAAGEPGEEAVADEVEEPEAEEAPTVEDEGSVEAPVVAEAFVLGEDTFDAFDAAIRADPDIVDAHYWRGWVTLELGDADTASGHFEAAIERNPMHVGAEIGMARTLLTQGILAAADARIQRVIDEFENDSSSKQRSDTFVVAAAISVSRLQPELAIESLLSALQADPTNAFALEMLGQQFARAEQYARAVEYFESNADLGEGDPETTIGLARSLIGLEAYDDARALLEAGLEQFPRDARFPYLLGRVYELEAEFELARQYYRQAVQIDPQNVRPMVSLAQLAERENMPAESLRMLDEAYSINTNSASRSNEIGEMYLRLGETNRAVTAFRGALAIDQSHPDARINLTEYYLNTGQQQRAIENLQEMINAGVDSPKVRFLNARALHGLEEFDRAIEELLVLQESDPDNAEYLFLLGLVHFDAGNHVAARLQFGRAYEEAPSMSIALYSVGRCDIELDNYVEAITALTTVSHRSSSGEYHYWLGVALEKGEQPAQAMVAYAQAIESDIAWSLEHPEVFHRRGRLYFLRGATSAAYRDLRTVLTLRPVHAEASWTLGRVHFDLREYNDAIRLLDHSLAIDAEQPEVHYQAGLSYLFREPVDLQAALGHLEAARDAGYGLQRPELFQKLGYVYRDLRRNADAAAALESYLEHANPPYDEAREMRNEIDLLGGRR